MTLSCLTPSPNVYKGLSPSCIPFSASAASLASLDSLIRLKWEKMEANRASGRDSTKDDIDQLYREACKEAGFDDGAVYRQASERVEKLRAIKLGAASKIFSLWEAELAAKRQEPTGKERKQLYEKACIEAGLSEPASALLAKEFVGRTFELKRAEAL